MKNQLFYLSFCVLGLTAACGGTMEDAEFASSTSALMAKARLVRPKGTSPKESVAEFTYRDDRAERARQQNRADRGRDIQGPSSEVTEDDIQEDHDVDPQGEGDRESQSSDCEETEFNDCAEIDPNPGNSDPAEEDDIEDTHECEDGDFIDCDPTPGIEQGGDDTPEEPEDITEKLAEICKQRRAPPELCEDIAEQILNDWDKNPDEKKTTFERIEDACDELPFWSKWCESLGKALMTNDNELQKIPDLSCGVPGDVKIDGICGPPESNN